MYLSWQNTNCNLKTTCHIKPKCFFWNKLLATYLLHICQLKFKVIAIIKMKFLLVVSATKRRRFNKIKCKTKRLAFAGFHHDLRELFLQTITHLMQNTVLDIQFLCVKCTVVTVGYAKISSNILFLTIQTTQAIKMDWLDENKLLQNAFKRI